MDFLKNLSSENKPAEHATEESTRRSDDSPSSGGFLGGFLGNNDKPEVTTGESTKKADGGSGGLTGYLHNALGGGAKGEAKEDPLDKSIDWVQEHILKQGAQDKEDPIEQHKDELISDTLRAQYKSLTGKDFPIKDKE